MVLLACVLQAGALLMRCYVARMSVAAQWVLAIVLLTIGTVAFALELQRRRRNR